MTSKTTRARSDAATRKSLAAKAEAPQPVARQPKHPDAMARLTPLDRPMSYVGRTLSRDGAKRAVAGRGTYTDDISLPRMLHAAFSAARMRMRKFCGSTLAAQHSPLAW